MLLTNQMLDMKYLQGIVFATILLGMASCVPDDTNIFGCRQPAGPLIEDAFFMGDFDGIKVSHDETVVITQGPLFSVVVEAPESIMQVVDLDNDSGTLVLRYDECVTRTDDVRLLVTLPELKCIDARGDIHVVSTNVIVGNKINIDTRGDITMDLALDMDEIDIDSRGNSNILLEGLCDELDIKVTGDAHVDAFDLTALFADVVVTGDGELFLTVLEFLDVKITGDGEVFFKGDPIISADITGDGHLVDAN